MIQVSILALQPGSPPNLLLFLASYGGFIHRHGWLNLGSWVIELPPPSQKSGSGPVGSPGNQLPTLGAFQKSPRQHKPSLHERGLPRITRRQFHFYASASLLGTEDKTLNIVTKTLPFLSSLRMLRPRVWGSGEPGIVDGGQICVRNIFWSSEGPNMYIFRKSRYHTAVRVREWDQKKERGTSLGDEGSRATLCISETVQVLNEQVWCVVGRSWEVTTLHLVRRRHPSLQQPCTAS